VDIIEPITWNWLIVRLVWAALGGLTVLVVQAAVRRSATVTVLRADDDWSWDRFQERQEELRLERMRQAGL